MLVRLALCAVLLTLPAVAKGAGTSDSIASATDVDQSVDTSILAGKWSYRSYIDTTDQVGDRKDKALAIIFGEGVYKFDPKSGNAFTGVLDMGGGYILDLKGSVTETTPLSVAISGRGRAGTPTAGWQYDYNASLAHRWPNGVKQNYVLLGTVVRVKPHGASAAGFVASFIAVKQP